MIEAVAIENGYVEAVAITNSRIEAVVIGSVYEGGD